MDMVNMYERATTSADVLNAQYTRKQEKNQWLKDQLQKHLVVLEKARE